MTAKRTHSVERASYWHCDVTPSRSKTTVKHKNTLAKSYSNSSTAYAKTIRTKMFLPAITRFYLLTFADSYDGTT